MTSPIKVGDIVRVTGVSADSIYRGAHAYNVEPLNHGTLTDIEAASVMLERAHHRIGELTRERNAAQDLADMRQNARAREAEAKLAERDHERDLRKAAERALAEAQAAFLREPSTHEKALKPIGAPRVHRQPNGYDPGARPVEAAQFPWAKAGTWVVRKSERAKRPAKLKRPFGDEDGWWCADIAVRNVHGSWVEETAIDLACYEPATPAEASRFEAELALVVGPGEPEESSPTKPEKAADPHAAPFAWVRPGVWAVWNGSVKGASPPIKLSVPVYSGWRGVTPSNVEDIADVLYRRPATPEETARFEAELAASRFVDWTCCDPMRPTCQQEGCEQCFPPKVVGPTSVLGAAIAWAGCLAESIRGWHPQTQRTEREWMEETFDRANKAALRAKCGDLVDAWDLAEPFQDWLDAGAPEVWPVKPNPTPLAVGEP